MQRKIRVLVGKPGLDGHDRGAKVVAAALRDAGMEVIYTGLHQTPEQIVEAAVQEDVDVVALSILSGAHMTLFPEVLERMKRQGLGDRLLTGGGIVPPEDMEALSKLGVGRLFGPGTSTQDIVAYIRGWFAHQYGEAEPAPAAPDTAWAGPSETPVRPAEAEPLPLKTTGRLAARRVADRAERLACLKAEAAHHLPAVRAAKKQAAAKPGAAAREKPATKPGRRAAPGKKTLKTAQPAKKGKAPGKKTAPKRTTSKKAAPKRTPPQARPRRRAPRRSARGRRR
jgi:methylmalonyl-CoA mutase C-terminal domain/subunit